MDDQPPETQEEWADLFAGGGVVEFDLPGLRVFANALVERALAGSLNAARPELEALVKAAGKAEEMLADEGLYGTAEMVDEALRALAAKLRED